MKQGFEISGVKFAKGRVISRASLAAFRANSGFLMN